MHIRIFCIFFTALIISGCSTSNVIHDKDHAYKILSREDKHHKKYIGHYKLGTKYKIKGKYYKPREYRFYNKTGIASWYGSRYGFHGKKTANGEIYNKNTLTAAHKTLPLPSLVRVTNMENSKSVIVMVNDRGPYVSGRIIDLSERAATLLGFHKKGIAKVRVKLLTSETKKLLSKLGIEKREGSIAKSALENDKCSVNCLIKMLNIKNKHKVIH